jgi:hypothetical protein
MAKGGRSRERLAANALAAKRWRAREKAAQRERERRLDLAGQRYKQLIAENKELAECVRQLEQKQQKQQQQQQQQQKKPVVGRGQSEALMVEELMNAIGICDGYIL